jgi:sn-glycerol 3-phosphate transport system substrate-binding protein
MRKVIIDAWVSDLTFPGYMDRWYKLAAEFEEAHPEYEVKIKGIDFFGGPQEIFQAISEGRGPAIAEYYSYMTQAARDTRNPDGSPRYVPVERAIGGRDEILGEPVVIGDLLPGVRECYTYDGYLTSLPSIATQVVFCANTTLLRAAGVTEPPRTWDEIEAACAAVTGRAGGPSHGITWANHGYFFQEAIAVQGGLMTNNDNGRTGRATTIDFTANEMMAWVTWWRDLHRAGHYLYTGKIPDWEGNFRVFAEQRVAMRITSSNDINYMVEAAKGGGFDIEVARFPYNGDTHYVGNALTGTSLWLADGLDEATRDGALAFLQFTHNPGNAAERHRANSFVPITQASFDLLEAEGWFDRYPYHRVASEQLATYPGRDGAGEQAPPVLAALFGDFAGAQDVMTRAMADVLDHGADPLARFAEATVEAQRLLDDYNTESLTTGARSPSSLRVEYFRDAEAYSGADLENVVQLDR